MSSTDQIIRQICPMRHENGDCLPFGECCVLVNDGICCGLRRAYDMGFYDNNLSKNVIDNSISIKKG